MSELDTIVNEFLVESYDNLDQMDRDFVELEQNPTEESLLANIFRTIHTIKGTCGFLGFSKLESIAHVGENLLSRLREGELVLNPEITDALLALVDAIREIMSNIETSQNEGEVDYSTLVETLTRLHAGESGAPGSGQAEAKAGTGPQPEPSPVPESALESAPTPETAPEPPAPENELPAPAETAAVVPQTPSAVSTAPSGRGEDKSPAPDRRPEGRSVAEANIRVDVGLLDTLMNLVGELVLARNQILQFSASEGDSKFIASTQTLNLITTELQEGVMKTRMQPIGNIWDKFPRVVRDLSHACGKKVRLVMEGKDTELDKTLIEAIKDPLTHIVRNAVDHGVEMPEVRVKNGKPEEGRLSLRAYHEGGQVNIEISDDGGGIDPEKLKEKALAKNLITPDQANRMSDHELVNIIFMPGFSTAEKVTNVSGRGVGMDVVKTNIEKIGGTVDIRANPGQGTTLRVKIPLTLAIIPALIVTQNDNCYAIPQVSLLELVRLEGEDVRTRVEMIQGTPVYRLRGNLLPLVYLDRELKVESANNGSGLVNIVVLQAGDRQFGLVVEGINDTEEIVVKPLSKLLKGIKAFAGATIMGDGKVALILDVMGLAQNARVVTEGGGQRASQLNSGAEETAGDRQTLLIFSLDDKGRMCIPLSQVDRLEEFKNDEVEYSGEQWVVQYRNEILPLLPLAPVLHNGGIPEKKEFLPTVVYSKNGRRVGLIVDQILDIVEESVSVQRESNRPGILGTIVVQNRVTDLLDLDAVIQMAVPENGNRQLTAIEKA